MPVDYQENVNMAPNVLVGLCGALNLSETHMGEFKLLEYDTAK